LQKNPSPEVALRAKKILTDLSRRRQTRVLGIIHQPDVNYPNDDVLIWKSPARNRRAFRLAPGTEVEILEEVDGDRFGTPHVMFKIRTADGREGWVPKSWCKKKAPGRKGWGSVKKALDEMKKLHKEIDKHIRESDLKALAKMREEKLEAFKFLQEEIVKAKPKGKKWSDLTEADRKAMVEAVFRKLKEKDFGKGIFLRDVQSLANEIWRKKVAEERILPKDDPAERWKKLVGKKFETIRRIDLRDEKGFIECPQVDVYEDAGKTKSVGQMNHGDWIIVLEEKGPMTKVKRRRDKKIAWIETKYIKRIYTKEDIEKGPKKPQEKGEEKGD
jgi:hypothetical protein